MVKELWEQPRIFSIPVPMPDNPLRNLNVYVVCTEKQNLIIDTGFNRTECRDALWEGIRQLGLDLSKTVLFLTHLHSDHVGLVYKTVAACPGCNAYEIAGRIKWSARGMQWENFSPHQKWFAMGETLAHLVHLTNCTRMIRRVEDGVANYYLP